MENNVIVIEQAYMCIRYRNWNLINEISGRKVTQSVQLNSKNTEDRVVLWYEHLGKLLGNSHEVTDENEGQSTDMKMNYDLLLSLAEVENCIQLF